MGEIFLPGNEDWQQLPPSEAVLWLFGIMIRGSVSRGTTGAGALSAWYMPSRDCWEVLPDKDL